MELKPEQALFLLQMTLPMLEREHQTTVKVLEAVPADKADYTPDPNSMDRGRAELAHCQCGRSFPALSSGWRVRLYADRKKNRDAGHSGLLQGDVR